MSPGDTGWDVFSLDYHVDGPISTVTTHSLLHVLFILFFCMWKLEDVSITICLCVYCQVFTRECMGHYLRVFNFLWRAKRMEYTLTDIWKGQMCNAKLLKTMPGTYAYTHLVENSLEINSHPSFRFFVHNLLQHYGKIYLYFHSMPTSCCIT